jgi:hypothetical protein
MSKQYYFKPMQLLFNPDYSCDSPLSDIKGAMIGLEGLPISETTRQALRTWRDGGDSRRAG